MGICLKNILPTSTNCPYHCLQSLLPTHRWYLTWRQQLTAWWLCRLRREQTWRAGQPVPELQCRQWKHGAERQMAWWTQMTLGPVGTVWRWPIAWHPATKQWNTINIGENMDRKTINNGENMEMAESRTSCNQTKQRKTINIGENMETADSRTSCNQTMERYQQWGEWGGGWQQDILQPNNGTISVEGRMWRWLTAGHPATKQ